MVKTFSFAAFVNSFGISAGDDGSLIKLLSRNCKRHSNYGTRIPVELAMVR